MKDFWNNLPEKTKFKTQLVLLFLLGVLLMALPWDLIFVSKQHPKIADFISRILTGSGEAVAIASVIAAVVDEAAKRKLLKEFAENVSEHIIGRLLPAELREQMFQYLTVDFVRRDWEITYDLRLQEEVSGTATAAQVVRHAKLFTTSSYVMENRSPFEKSYTVAYEVVQKWFKDLKAPEIRSVVIDHKAIYSKAMTKADTQDEFVKLDFMTNKALIVPIPGYDATQKAHHVQIKLVSVEYLGDTFYTSFEALHPVLNTTVRVRHYDQFQVALYLTFADNSRAIPDMPGDGGEQTWTISTPILPGQGFLLRWRPR